MSQRSTLFLVDGSGYIFRAYFAVRHLSTSAGQPTNAVFGFTTMLLKVLRERRPEHIAVAFDLAGKTFRHTMYGDYKANRPPLPEDLRPQIPLVHRTVEALAIPVVTLAGYEADDVLGSLARQGVAAGLDVVILTGDKDLMQLVDERVTLYDGLKDKHIGRAEVVERFGVPPEHVIDVLALAGDASDNVPGVRGIGEKTAAALVQEYGDVEAILAAAPAIKQKARREKLLADAELARLSRRLVTIDIQAPVALDLEAVRYRGPDGAACRKLFGELEFHRLLADPLFAGATASEVAGAAPAYAAAPTEPSAAMAAATVDRDRYRTIVDEQALAEVVAQCRAAGRFAIDTETDGLDPMRTRLVGISLAWADNGACYIPCGHQPSLAEQQLTLASVIEGLGPLLADGAIAKVAQNGKFDRSVLLRHGMPEFEVAGDPMLASYLLDPGENAHGLDALALRHLGHNNIAFEEVCGKGKEMITFDRVPLDAATRYSAEDADVTLRLETLLRPRLVAGGLDALYRELELPLARVLGDMERCGVEIDGARLDRMSEEMQRDLASVAEQCQQLAGHAFNLASPKQVAQVLFEELKLPVVKRTKSGPSTDADVLEALQHQHALPERLLEHRLISKLKNTYVDVLPRLVNPETGRVHTQFNQAVAATGRLSSSDPNLQNIPVRTVQGRRIREAFVAPAGRRLLSADYSQIELRILAHVSQDPRFVEAFLQGQDIHARTASEVFGVPLDQVTKQQRQNAKAINFGLLYGMGAFRLAQQLGIAHAAAKAYLEAYFERYAGIQRWHDQTLQQARSDGQVATLFGRRRILHELSSKNHNERQAAERIAINTPIQGTAADIIKRAMLAVDRTLRRAAPSARLLLQVHDELVVEVAEAEVEAARDALVQAMSGAAELRVPLLVEVGIGRSWAEAH